MIMKKIFITITSFVLFCLVLLNIALFQSMKQPNMMLANVNAVAAGEGGIGMEDPHWVESYCPGPTLSTGYTYFVCEYYRYGDPCASVGDENPKCHGFF